MIKKVLQRGSSNKGYGFWGALLLLVIWWTVCRLGIWSTYLLPSPEKISSTFDSSPIPHHRISNGIILRGGIFRKKCIMGLVQAAKPLFIPFSNPSSIAEIKANVIPQATLCRLTSIALKSSPPEHSSKNVCRIKRGEVFYRKCQECTRP